MYAPSVIDARRSGLSFARRTYLPRIVGLGIGFLCVFSVLYSQQPGPWVWGLLIFHGFIWPETRPTNRSLKGKIVGAIGNRLNFFARFPWPAGLSQVKDHYET